MVDTARLSLPLMDAAQAQKHVTHNDALVRLDAITHLSVVTRAKRQRRRFRKACVIWCRERRVEILWVIRIRSPVFRTAPGCF